MTYLAPLKLAVVDAEGTMRLHYWPKNDLMKGPKLPAEDLALLLPTAAAAAHDHDMRDGGERVIATPLNTRNGTILEGSLPSCSPGAIIFKAVSAPTPPPPAPPAPPPWQPPWSPGTPFAWENISTGAPGSGSFCDGKGSGGGGCIFNKTICKPLYGGQCGILVQEVDSKCGTWSECAGVVCRCGKPLF
jgi:hypothetical protein